MAEGETQQDFEPASSKPEFEIKGTTVITHLSSSPNGFEVKTKQSLRRREGISLPYPAEAINKANKKEKDYWNKRNREEGKDVDPLRKDFRIIVGFKNIEEKNNVLEIDTRPLTYVMFSDDEVGLTKPENLEKGLELAGPVGISIVILTTEKDGARKIILQHRGTENRAYRDIPGASASGYFEGKLHTLNSPRDQTGKLFPVNTASIIKGTFKEAEEELGIDDKNLIAAKITGVSTDLVRPHYDILLSATTNLNSEEIVENAMVKSQIERRPFDFSEDFLFIDGTPEAIETLLTESKCPLAPGHITAFFAVGYQMKLEKDGPEEAEKWKKRIEKATQQNYDQINETVKISTNGKHERYNPRLTPQEQGLPDFTSEMKRVGLIEDADEELSNSETMKTVDYILIFDVDGVITNPQEKRITEPEILDQIIKRLEKGEPVSLNTGRSLVWMVDRMINPLLEKVKDKKILKYFFASGEMGATWITFSEEGVMEYHKDDLISVPKSLQERVRKLIETKYSDSMFYDESKETMITTEMKDGYSVEKYKKFQDSQNQELRDLVQQENLSQEIIVDSTTIATNVENKYVGKGFAVKRIVEWLRNIRIKPQRYLAFGDSFRSDMPMAQEINLQGLPIEFVYVGKENVDSSAYTFTIHQTQAKFEKGTLEFLKNL